ncbi:unnamed protein product [Bursaphelenchus okinawaensis]|uniref:Ataxin-3 homolog n=1 Tax=Bursaphelenchus okinawaensis TaxID=465554 RepID=A0A811LGC7_9BILA|nr:unnamed protein product [Bursaphelenchus okinawaensis]CAG9122346.1 unnamed protein product [Bursaphelenchus okinawaensis]
MDIFFEKQDGMLCAQHALNMLLQTRMYTALDLGDIARQLDEQEKALLPAEQRALFVSSNMDDSGFFSIQVIRQALRTLGLDLVSLENPELVEVKLSPKIGNAFICNMELHWFTLRNIFGAWYELNSMKDGPKVISDGFLDVYISQLVAEGYSVFHVEGDLSNFVNMDQRRGEDSPLMYQEDDFAKALELSKLEKTESEDDELQRAISLSMKPNGYEAEIDEELKKAIAMSLEDHQDNIATSSRTVDHESFMKSELSGSQSLQHSEQEPRLNGGNLTDSGDLSDLRRKREAFLSRFS